MASIIPSQVLFGSPKIGIEKYNPYKIPSLTPSTSSPHLRGMTKVGAFYGKGVEGRGTDGGVTP